MLVSKRRFKRDDGSEYPAMIKNSLEKALEEKKNYGTFETNYPLLTSSRKGLMYQNEFRDNLSTSNKTTLFSIVSKGECTYRHMSDDSIFHFNINTLCENGLVSKEYPVFNTKSGYDLKFIVQHLNSSSRFLEFCRQQKKGGTRTRLYFKTLCEYEMFFPCLEEQQKISDFLSTVDEVITHSEAEVTNLEQQKKATIQKLFSQEVRFKRADGTEYPEWNKYRLEEVVDFLDEKRKPITSKDRKKGQYPYYGASGIIDYIDDYIFEEELVLLSEDGANIIDRNYRVAFVAMGKYWVNNHAHCLRPKQGFNSCFISEALENIDYTTYNTGSAQPKLNQDICRNLPLDCPCLEEQQNIAKFLSAYDEAISYAKQELDKWKVLKKGLLQQMFI